MNLQTLLAGQFLRPFIRLSKANINICSPTYVQVEDINEVPNPKLAVFKRVELAPGEEKMVTLENG